MSGENKSVVVKMRKYECSPVRFGYKIDFDKRLLEWNKTIRFPVKRRKGKFLNKYDVFDLYAKLTDNRREWKFAYGNWISSFIDSDRWSKHVQESRYTDFWNFLNTLKTHGNK